jgi:1-deoxy-D-xylulose-5-phosphate synthase
MVPPPVETDAPCPPFERGRSRVIREGSAGTILAYGAMVRPALLAADILGKEGHDFAVIDARFAKPLDREEICGRLSSGKPLLTVEDHSVIGGFGSAALELAAAQGLSASNIDILGIPDKFVPHSSRKHQLRISGLDPKSIAAAAQIRAQIPIKNKKRD